MTIIDMCEETVTLALATHYNPHWMVIACKWVALHVVVAIAALRSKL